jgi:hypothetical protein
MGFISKVVTMGAKEVVVKPMMKQLSEKKNAASSSSDSASSYSFRNTKPTPSDAISSQNNSKNELDKNKNYPDAWKTKIKAVAAETSRPQNAIQELNFEIGDIIIICGQGRNIFILNSIRVWLLTKLMKEGHGWVNGLNLRSGQFGSFPLRYAENQESITLDQFVQLRQEHLKKSGSKSSPLNSTFKNQPVISSELNQRNPTNGATLPHPILPPRLRAVSNPVTPSESTFASQKINSGMGSSSLLSLREALETPPPLPQRSRAATVTPSSYNSDESPPVIPVRPNFQARSVNLVKMEEESSSRASLEPRHRVVT